MDFHSMKRKDLQALCKKHNLPANKTNLEMANNLASLLKKPDVEPLEEKLEVELLKGVDGSAENDSNDATKKAKRVRFSLEEEEQSQIETEKKIHGGVQLKSAMKPGFEKCNNLRVTRSRKVAEVVLSSPVGRKKSRKDANSGNGDGEKKVSGRRSSMGAQANNAVGMTSSGNANEKDADVIDLVSPVESKMTRQRKARIASEDGEKKVSGRRSSMGAQANKAVGMTSSGNANEKDAEIIDLVSPVESKKTRQRKARIATKEVVEEVKNTSELGIEAPRRSRRNTDHSVALDEKSELLSKGKFAAPEIEIQAANGDSKRAPEPEKATKRSKRNSRFNNKSDQSDARSRTYGAINKNASLEVEVESKNAPELEQAVRRSKRTAPMVKEFYKTDELPGSTGNQKPLQCITNIVEPPRTSHGRTSKRKSVAVIDAEVRHEKDHKSVTLECIANTEDPPRTSHGRASKRKSVAVTVGEVRNEKDLRKTIKQCITNTEDPPRTSHGRTSKRKSMAVIEGEVRHEKELRKTIKQKQEAKAESSVSVTLDSDLGNSSNMFIPSTGVERNALPQEDTTECQKIDTNETQGSVIPNLRAKKSSGKGRRRKSSSKLPNKKIDSQKEFEVSTEVLTDNFKSGLGCIKEVPEDVNDEVVSVAEAKSVELCAEPGLQVNATPEPAYPLVDTSLKEQGTDTVKESSCIDEPVKTGDEPREMKERLTDNVELLVGNYAKFDETVGAARTNGSSEIQVEVGAFNEEASSDNDGYGQPLSSTDATLLAPNESTPCYSTMATKDASVTSSKSVRSSRNFKEAAEENQILAGNLDYSGEAPSKEKLKQSVTENKKEDVEGVMHLSSELDLSESSIAQHQEVLKEKTAEVRQEGSAGNLVNLNVMVSCEADDKNEAKGSLLEEPGMKNVQETSSVEFKEPLISPRGSVTAEDYLNFSKTIISPVSQAESEGDNDVAKMRVEKVLGYPEEIATLETNHDCTDGGNVTDDESIGTVPISPDAAYSQRRLDVDMNLERTKNDDHELSEQAIVDDDSDGILITSQAYSPGTVNIKKSEKTEDEPHEVLEAYTIFESNTYCDDGRNNVDDENRGTSPISQACIPNTVDVEVNAETMEAIETPENAAFEANHAYNDGRSHAEDGNNEISPISQEAGCCPCDVERADEAHERLEEKTNSNYVYKDGGIDENKGTPSMEHGYSTIDVKMASVTSTKSARSSKAFKDTAEANRVSVCVLEYSTEAFSKEMDTQSVIGNQKEHVKGVLDLSPELDLVSVGESSIVKSREVLEEKTVEVGPEDSAGNLEKLNLIASCKVDDKIETEFSLLEEIDMKNVREASSVKIKEPPILHRESVTTEDHLNIGNSSIKTFSSPVSQGDLERDSDVAKMGVEKILGFPEIATPETQNESTDGRNVADTESIWASTNSQARSPGSVNIEKNVRRIEESAHELLEIAIFESNVDCDDGGNLVEDEYGGTSPISRATDSIYIFGRAEVKITMVDTVEYDNIVGEVEDTKNLQQVEGDIGLSAKNIDVSDENAFKTDGSLGETSGCKFGQNAVNDDFVAEVEEAECFQQAEVEDTKYLQQAEVDNGLIAEFLQQNIEDLVNLNQAVSEPNDKITDVSDENAIKADGSLDEVSCCMVDQNVVDDEFVVEVEEAESFHQAEDNGQHAASLQQHTDDIVDLKHAVSGTDNSVSAICNVHIIKDGFLETSDFKVHKDVVEDNSVETSPSSRDTLEGQNADVVQQAPEEIFNLKNDELHTNSKSDKDTINAKFIEELEEYISDSSGIFPFLEACSPNSNDFDSNTALVNEEKHAESSQQVQEQINEPCKGYSQSVCDHFNVELDQQLFKSDSLKGEALHSNSFNGTAETENEDDDSAEDEEDTVFSQVPKGVEDGYAELDKNMLEHQEAEGSDYKTMPECEEKFVPSKGSPSHDICPINGSRDSSMEMKDEETSQGIGMEVAETKDNMPGLIVTVLDENISGSSAFTENNKDTTTDCLVTKEEAEVEFHLDIDSKVEQLGLTSSDHEKVKNVEYQVICSEPLENIISEKEYNFDGDYCDNVAFDFVRENEMNLLSEVASDYTRDVQAREDNIVSEGSLVVSEESTEKSNNHHSDSKLLCERFHVVDVERSSDVNTEQGSQMHKKVEVDDYDFPVQDYTIQESYEVQQQEGSKIQNHETDVESVEDVTLSSQCSDVQLDSAIITEDTGGHANTARDQVVMEEEYLDSKVNPPGAPSHDEDAINEKVDVEEVVSFKHLEDVVTEKDNAGKELADAVNTSGDTFSFEEEDTGFSVVIALAAHSGANNVVSEEQCEVNDVNNKHTCKEDKSEEESLKYQANDWNVITLSNRYSALADLIFSEEVAEEKEVCVTGHENVSTSQVLDTFVDEENCSVQKEKQADGVYVSESSEVETESYHANDEHQTRLETTGDSPSYDSSAEPENASRIQGYETEIYEFNACEINLFSEDNEGKEVATFIRERTFKETSETIVKSEAVPEEQQDTFVDEENCIMQKDQAKFSEVEMQSCHENDEHQTRLETTIGSPSHDSKMEHASTIHGDTESNSKTEIYELNEWEIRLFSEDNPGNDVETFIQNRAFEETLEAKATCEGVLQEKDDMFHIKSSDELQTEIVSIHEESKNEGVDINMTDKEENIESSLGLLFAMEETEVHETMIQSTPKKEAERNVMDDIYSMLTKMHISSTVKAKRSRAFAIQKTPKRPSGLSITGMKENVQQSSNMKGERSVTKRRVFEDLQNIRNR